eukprot:gene9083-12249_t
MKSVIKLSSYSFKNKNLVQWRGVSSIVPTDLPADTSKPQSESSLLAALKPKEIVDQLNNFIVGQSEAKRAVAIALRNRWRRHQLSDQMKNEVIPKNILMIGPTGCGKTEIARRIAKLSQAPFIKVEATKFTEVGFHGKDVDQIIRELVDISIGMTKKKIKEKIKADVVVAVEEKIVDYLIGTNENATQRLSYLEMLRSGLLEGNHVEFELPQKSSAAMAFDISSATSGFGDFLRFAKGVHGPNKRPERKKMTVSEARTIIEEAETERLLEDYDIPKEAIAAVEESGIVFIDEIDKLVSSGEYRGADASSEGVQRDLLPLIEGSAISTKHGNVNTDYILFIASGAFHSSKPSDLLAELQGRLPIRVTLKGLTEDDLYRILTEPVTNLIKQQVALLKAENVELEFTDEAIREIAKTNKSVENIGARRLHTIIERVIEEISFDASDKAGEKIQIDQEYVKTRVSDVLLGSDLRKYIL